MHSHFETECDPVVSPTHLMWLRVRQFCWCTFTYNGQKHSLQHTQCYYQTIVYATLPLPPLTFSLSCDVLLHLTCTHSPAYKHILHCVVVHDVLEAHGYGFKCQQWRWASHVAQEVVIVQRFDHEGLRQVQNCFVPDEDVHGRNVVLLWAAQSTQYWRVSVHITVISCWLDQVGNTTSETLQCRHPFLLSVCEFEKVSE